MSIAMVARGQVAGEPTRVSSDRGSVVSFLLGEVEFQSKFDARDHQAIEVVCRDSLLGRQALNRLDEKAFVIVVGTLRVSKPPWGYADGDLVLVTIEADAIGIDLARADPRAIDTSHRARSRRRWNGRRPRGARSTRETSS